MKILLFISKLYGGGAERVATTLLNHLCENHDVTVAIFNKSESTYPIDNRIKIINLSDGKKISPYQLDRIIKCRNAIKSTNPDLIISFLVGLSRFVLIANCFMRKKLILSEQTTIQTRQKPWKWLTRHFLYRLATMTVFTSESDCQYAQWLKNKTFIHNPLSCGIYTSHDQKRDNTIVAIGAQKRWNVKGFDLLIKAWAKTAPNHPEWKLQFIGAIDDNKISDMAKAYSIEKQVEFLGWSENIDKMLQSKSIYVLSSRCEGFPCSLLEAMSQGCTCLAFDCKTGPNEILSDGINGLLVHNGDIDNLATKLNQLIEDEHLRLQLSKNAIDKVHQFEYGRIMQQWDELIQMIMNS